MITVIIPSFNRSSQLDCLLRSFQKYWDIEQLNIKVLAKASDQKFADGYKKLLDNCTYPHVGLWWEKNFEYDYKMLLEHTNSEFIMLATDDCVLFNKIPFAPQHIDKVCNDEVHCVSLRLGLNTVIQDYVHNTVQASLFNIGYQHLSGMIKWKFKRFNLHENYGYPFSLDLTIYNSKKLNSYVDQIRFDSPRSLEHNLCTKIDRKDLPDYMVSPENSVGFINTINGVQPEGPPAGTQYYYSAEELNEKFLNGERINLSSFDGLELNSAHYEVPLTFERF